MPAFPSRLILLHIVLAAGPGSSPVCSHSRGIVGAGRVGPGGGRLGEGDRRQRTRRTVDQVLKGERRPYVLLAHLALSRRGGPRLSLDGPVRCGEEVGRNDEMTDGAEEAEDAVALAYGDPPPCCTPAPRSALFDYVGHGVGECVSGEWHGRARQGRPLKSEGRSES